MMDIDTDAIWAEIDDAIRYDDIPDHAVTVKDVMAQRNVSMDAARRALRKLEANGWQTGKRGMYKYWWPGE